MKNNVLVWGYLSALLLLLGAIFKNLDFVAGKVLFLVGFFTFNLGYLIPLFLVIFKNNQENRIGLIIVFSILGFFIFLMGVTFFMVNWGGGMVLIYVGGSFLLLTVLLMLFMSRRFYETSIDSWFPIVLFSVFIVIGMLTSMVHRPVLRSFTISNQEDVARLASQQIKNDNRFAELIEICERDTALLPIKVAASNAMQQSDSLLGYIDSLKRELIVYVEGKKYLQDSNLLENLVPIQSNVEINAVKKFMLGKKRRNAYILHKKLDLYQDNMLNTLSEKDDWFVDFVKVNLSTEVLKLNKRRYNRDWERQHFYDFPLVTVVSQLTRLQLRISIVQGEVISNYRREAFDQYDRAFSEQTEK